MTRWTPEARAEYMAAIGAESAFIRQAREESIRSGHRQLGELGPVGAVEALYGPAPVVTTVIDQEASLRSQRLVTRSRTINALCECGREASVPPVELHMPFTCEWCWRAEWAGERDAQSELALATRSIATDLPELQALYNQPGGLPNLLRRR
jgi:hypothetical protein